MVLTYEQYRKIENACYAAGSIDDKSDDTSKVLKKRKYLYCGAYIEQGVKVYLHGQSGRWYRLRVQIEPCRALGEKDPTAVAKLDKDTYQKLVKAVNKILKKLKVPCSVDKMKISRCDWTVNLAFSGKDELTECLRIIKKSLIPSRYTHVFFKKGDKKAKDYKSANAHSYCVSCKSASFLAYDKIAQLQMIGRCDETLLGKHILRLEAELERPALKKHLGKSAMGTNYKILSSSARNCRKIVRWYLKRLQPECERYLRYKDAIKLVEKAELGKKTRKRMLFLLRKASDKDSLTTALDDMQEKFNLSKGQCKNVLKKFSKLGISPITLANSSKFDVFPALNDW